jgi:thiol-disulfide isomerase/thioredoxin
MFQKLLLTAVLVLATAGCGGNETGNGRAAKTADTGRGAAMAETRTTPAPGPAETAEAQSPKEEGQEIALQAAPPGGKKIEAPAEKPASSSVKPSVSTSRSSSTDADMAKADARRRAGFTGKHSKPAVDTSQLRAAPNWTLTDLDGNQVQLADFKGQVVLLDFWATWCGPCRMSIPHLKDLYAEYKDKGLAVVGISLDQQGPAVVRPFVRQQKINYPIVMGNLQVTQDYGGIRGIPTAFVISQDGKIYNRHMGLVPRQVYEKDIRALLGLTS